MPINKTHWSKLMIPPGLFDMVKMISKKQGFASSDVHLFIYHMLGKLYPEDVERLKAYLEEDWQEPDEQSND